MTTKSYALPTNEGTAGQVLTSNGPGVRPAYKTSTSSLSYGAFYDTTQQPLISTTAAQLITINTPDLADGGITLVGGSKVTVSVTGIYNLQFSAQFANNNNTIYNANIWLRKNFVTGTGNDAQFDVPFSNGQCAIPNKHGNINGQLIVSWNYVMSFVAGDYVQFWWGGESTHLSIETIPAGTTPTTPVSPSIIVTMCQIR
jgi:hypothetical protein